MKRIFNWLFILFVFTIPIIPIELNVKILIVVLIFSFMLDQFHFSFTEFVMQTWVIFFYLAILLLGIFYSNDVNFGLSVLETNFSFAAIGILGGRYKEKSFDKLDLIFLSFTAGVICACLV